MGDMWKNVVRVAHLPGGLRAYNPPGPQVEIEPYENSKPLIIQLSVYRQLQAALEKLGLPVLGVEFFDSQGQLDGH